MLEMDRKMQGRFKSKNKENLGILESMIKNRIASLEINIKNAEEQIAQANAALKIIEDLSYRHDEPAYETPGDAMMRRMSGGF